jgi:DNA (cytosine-5)-methyltransferase 1
MLRVGSLCSGIGGLELGFERTGCCKVVWQAEIEPYACAILKKHFPATPNLGDITAINYELLDPVDIIVAGIPCQPHSQAGKRKASADKRDLWPEYRRAIGELRPTIAVLENVPGIFTSDNGRFFGRILADLAEMGYDAEWGVVSAQDVGAPHLRKRVFIVAYRHDRFSVEPFDAICARRNATGSEGQAEWVSDTHSQRLRELEALREPDNVADSNNARHHRTPRHDGGKGEEEIEEFGLNPQHRTVRCCSQSAIADCDCTRLEGRFLNWRNTNELIAGARSANIGTGGCWESDAGVLRVAHGVPNRVHRIKCLGNAVVPQVAQVIAQAIIEGMNNHHHQKQDGE